VLFGCQLGASGKLGKDYESRIAEAARYLRDHPKAYLIITGGPSRRGLKQTEAQAAKAKLVELGVPVDRVILENRALDTAQNAEKAAAIIRRMEPDPKHLQVTAISTVNVDRAASDLKRALGIYGLKPDLLKARAPNVFSPEVLAGKMLHERTASVVDGLRIWTYGVSKAYRADQAALDGFDPPST
jgi:hypothetical protein